MLTQNRLKELLSYNEDTGVFMWIKKPNNRCNNIKLNMPAGKAKKGRHLSINIDGVRYFSHRLAWFYMYGYMPNHIDHKNGDRQDNRLCNLRDVDNAENMKNKKLYKTNTSGVQGVAFREDANRWYARISVDGKYIHLGSFAEYHEAVNARKNAEVLYGYHKNHGRK